MWCKKFQQHEMIYGGLIVLLKPYKIVFYQGANFEIIALGARLDSKVNFFRRV